jgi:RNA polymerase sigma-70 factor (ECF subfamily)
VVQEAAMTGLRKLDTFTPGSNYAAWMGQIVRLTALNHRRKVERRARRDAGVDPDALAAVSDDPAPSGFDARTRAALDILGEVPRSCLLLKSVLELEYAEIAAVLEIPEGTAMSHVHRARKKMRALLHDPVHAEVAR